jgi:hypothetical protein
MDKVQKLSSPECNTPPSEPFRKQSLFAKKGHLWFETVIYSMVWED